MSETINSKRMNFRYINQCDLTYMETDALDRPAAPHAKRSFCCRPNRVKSNARKSADTVARCKKNFVRSTSTKAMKSTD